MIISPHILGGVNSCLQSENFGTTWGGGNQPTITADTDVAPDGLTTADKLDDTTTGFQRMEQTITVPNNGLSHCFSVFIKKTTSDTHRAGISIILSGGTSLRGDFTLNTNNGVMTARSIAGQNSAGFGFEETANYYRFYSAVMNNSSGNTSLILAVFPAIATSDTGSWAGSPTGFKIFWGMQVNPGIAPVTYAKTTTVAVP